MLYSERSIDHADHDGCYKPCCCLGYWKLGDTVGESIILGQPFVDGLTVSLARIEDESRDNFPSN